MLQRKDFYHQRIKYSFHYHEDRLKQLRSNFEAVKRLEHHFKKVSKGDIPNNIFNTRSIPRVSKFKIRGLKRAFIISLSKSLIRSEKVLRYNGTHDLSSYAQKVYRSYKKNQINKKPGHDPILKNILIKDPKSVAIEIPIWKKVDDQFITGHIDLIQIEKEVVKVIDYKPEGNFLYSLPQVATYGLLVKSQFNIPRLHCISFNKEEVWEYKPEILYSDIKEYLITQGIKNRKWEKFI